MRRTLLEVAACLLAVGFFIHAAPLKIVVSQPYLRLIPGGVPAAGYFNITNYASEPLVLVGAQSFDCGQIMMHKSTNIGGMSRMEDVHSLSIARGQRIAFAPGSYHLMCMHPSAALKVGGTARIKLNFAGGASSEITFYVVNARGLAQ